MDGTPWVALARASHSAPDPRAANGFMLASFVLVMYEWVLTADSEIQHIWLKPWTAFTAYWVAARYLPIAGRILGFIGVFKLSWTHEACKRFAPSSGIIFGCSLCVGHLALLMRVHVLWERRWAITLLPSILWFLELGANVYPIFDYTSIGSPLRGVPGCTAMTLGRRESLRLIAAIAMAVAFDLSVTGLLLLRSASLDRQRSSRHPLVHMLLMHGVAYFIIVLLLNVLNLVFLVARVDATLSIFMIMLVTTIPNIVINRMILSLRAYESCMPLQDPQAHPTQHPVQTSRSIKLTSPFGLNTILETFRHPLDAPAAPADMEYPLADLTSRRPPPGPV